MRRNRSVYVIPGTLREREKEKKEFEGGATPKCSLSESLR